MTRYEIESELDKLYQELNVAHTSDEETVCKIFGSDSKKEAIRAITENIDFYEDLLKEMYNENESYDLWDDHGFANEADYIHWRYGA